jgi:hypothetical protein
MAGSIRRTAFDVNKKDQNKARFSERLSKNIGKEKEGQKDVRDQDKQDNALKASMYLFSLQGAS